VQDPLNRLLAIGHFSQRAGAPGDEVRWQSASHLITLSLTDGVQLGEALAGKLQVVTDEIVLIERRLMYQLRADHLRRYTTDYSTGWAKKCDTLLLPLLLDALLTHVSFSWRSSSSADVNKFCFMRINCNFVTMVERWMLFDSQSACWETPGFRKNYENVFQ